MEFPYGKAALAMLVLALGSAAALIGGGAWAKTTQRRPDLVMATFTKDHALSYRAPIAEFEKENNCTVQLQVVDQRALQGRLQSALQVGADVPDMVELLYGTLGVFTRGPTDGIGFVDLSEHVERAGLRKSLVESRFGQWSAGGRV